MSVHTTGTHSHSHTHTSTGGSPGMSLSQAVLELPIGEGSLLELRNEALEVCPERHRQTWNCDNNCVSIASKHLTNSLIQSQRVSKRTWKGQRSHFLQIQFSKRHDCLHLSSERTYRRAAERHRGQINHHSACFHSALNLEKKNIRGVDHLLNDFILAKEAFI